MATIDSTVIIADMLQNDGIYPGDTQVKSIFQYHNTMFEKTCYSVCYAKIDEMALFDSFAVGETVKLWDNDTGLTVAGQSFIDEHS